MPLLIVEWHDKCVQSFGMLCDALEKSNSDFDDRITLGGVLDQFGRFRVWAGNIGAHQHGRVSLDYRLRDASRLKGQIIKFLEDLDETLHDGRQAALSSCQQKMDVMKVVAMPLPFSSQP